MEVRQERTGWRDQALSERHRRWGWDCPMLDIDFLALEYDKGVSVAIVEYKHENAEKQYSSHPSYRALRDLGDKADLPVFAVRYAGDFAWWLVVPLNSRAKQVVPERKKMTEREWVEVLYRLRNYELPDGLFDGLEEI